MRSGLEAQFRGAICLTYLPRGNAWWEGLAQEMRCGALGRAAGAACDARRLETPSSAANAQQRSNLELRISRVRTRVAARTGDDDVGFVRARISVGFGFA